MIVCWNNLYIVHWAKIAVVTYILGVVKAVVGWGDDSVCKTSTMQTRELEFDFQASIYNLGLAADAHKHSMEGRIQVDAGPYWSLSYQKPSDFQRPCLKK